MHPINVCITGGTGFFGKWLIKTQKIAHQFLGQEINLLILCRNFQKFEKSFLELKKYHNVKLLKGDVRNFGFPKEKIDYIIHCAMPSNYEDFSKEEILDIGINGTKRALELAKVKKVKKFLFVSSGVVYGRQPEYIDKISEKDVGFVQLDPYSPKTYYAEAKRIGELLCFSAFYEQNINVVITRCFSFLGPYMHLSAHLAVGNFIRDALKGGPIVIKSDGTKINSYMYAEDLGVWLWTILLRGKSGEVYNVGSEKKVSLRELAEKIAEISKKVLKLDKIPEVIVQKKPDPEKLPERYVPSTKKARSELGLKELTSLEDAIEKTLKFYQSFQGALPDFQRS
ncbi:MAG: NAD-dependent epimerase/dehydratase family protein [Thermodesulfobacteria bacterium]|nr:NAD-dependent epimerase/dehydratase family protein [Thermodesulfobacteriota bacterium]